VVWTIVVTVIVIVLACAVVIAGGRFLTLRSRGIPVVVRRLPSPEGRHWRHGVLVYGGMTARVFKVRSLRPESDFEIHRQGTGISGRREITEWEAQFLEPDLHVMEVEDGGTRFEVALDEAGDTALVAWLESAPSTRQVRSVNRVDPRRGLDSRS
jgi:hypothetical protein